MSYEPQSLDDWINLFSSTNVGKPEDINRAQTLIEEKLKSDPLLIMNVSSQILLANNNDPPMLSSKSMAAILLVRTLEFRSPAELDFKRKNLPPDLAEPIKNSIRKNIFSQNVTIRNMCARSYSLLFSILLGNWPEAIDDIVNFFQNNDLLPYGFIGLISVMKEIVNQKIFISEIAPRFGQQLGQTIVFCVEILSKEVQEPGYIAELRIEAANFLHDIIFVYPQIFNEGDKIGGKILLVLENIPNSFQVGNLNLFTILHQLLFIIIKRFYLQTPNFIRIIDQYVRNGFGLIRINPLCVNVSIYFWKEVASFEENLLQKQNLRRKLGHDPFPNTPPPLEPLLSDVAIDNLIDSLIDFIEKVSYDDTAVEDVHNNPQPSMFATVTLQALYKINPQKVFDRLSNQIVKDIQKEQWVFIHSALLMIYAVADEPKNESVGIFIAQNFERILQATEPSQVPRLRETALFVIGLTIKNYPQIITQARESTDPRISKIIDSIMPTLQINEEQQRNLTYDHKQIYIRYASIVYHLSAAWKNNSYESHLSTFWDAFYEIACTLFNFGITCEDHMLITNSSEALNQLIFNSSPDVLNKLDWLFNRTLEMLTQSKTMFSSKEIRFLVQSSLCSNISTLLLKLRRVSRTTGPEFISRFATRTLDLLFELLSNKHSLIYEEGLMAISALVSATNTNFHIPLFTPDNFNQLLTYFIYNGLISMNAGVINASCLLIGNLFFYLGKTESRLLELAPDIFNSLKDIILKNRNMREIHPFVLKAISDIFLNCEADKITQLEPDLRGLITSVQGMSTELDISEKNDVEYGNLFYQYLTDCFGGYARCFYNNSDYQIERAQLFLLDKLSFFIGKLYPKINDNLYKSFIKCSKEFANNCSRKNNVILNRHSVHKILKDGVETAQDPNVRKACKENIDFLKSK